MEQARSEPVRRVRWAQLWIDASVVFVAYLLTLIRRFDGQVPERFWAHFRWFIPIVIAIYVVTNAVFRLYTDQQVKVGRVVLVGLLSITLVYGASTYTPGPQPLPLSVVLVGGLVSVAGFIFSRRALETSRSNREGPGV